MSRLTKTNWKNLDPWETCGQGMYCTRNCHEDGGCANGCPVPKNYRRLAKYENTGLTPEEIKEQIEILEHNYKCMEDTLERQYDNALKIVNKLEKECDYWEVEAKKWASELGEKKLERGK